jgi:alpha-glucosidase
MKKILIPFVLAVVFISCQPAETSFELSSPDNNVSITFNLNDKNEAVYSVLYQGEAIIAESPLALEFKSGVWDSNLVIKKSWRREINEPYALVVGKSDSARNHCNEMGVQVVDKSSTFKVNIIFRAYDDGAAFRYEFPKQNKLNDFELMAEKTEFRFAENHKCWALQLGRYTTSYEKEFEPMTINDIGDNALVGLPLTIEIKNGPTVAITEANLTDYAGLYLNGASTDNALVSSLSPLPGEEICVRGKTPHVSPWRVIMIGEKPGDLIESNLIVNLNEPLALDDVSWIKAGRVAWDWWSGQVVDDPNIESGMNDATMQHYINFAADNGLEYMLIDAGWAKPLGERRNDILESIPDIHIPDLVSYANNKGVDILIWLHWTSVKAQIDDAFPLYEQWGVKGVKIDFMDRDDQEMVNFYHEMVQKAAKHHLMVDFHGAYKPTGLRRTWPNLMTREGILGLEYLKWSDRATAEHNVTAPFTRMLAGPMDYTPGGFRNVTPDNFKPQRTNPMTPTTRCHQLAMFVVYESPLQMLADAPANYRGQVGLDFITQVPATWDETKVIAGEIGDYIAVARRAGNTWYIGAMTDGTARSLDLSVDFLGEAEYQAHLWSDGPGAATMPTRVTTSQTRITKGDVLSINMAPDGGFAAILQKNVE